MTMNILLDVDNKKCLVIIVGVYLQAQLYCCILTIYLDLYVTNREQNSSKATRK